MGAADAVDVVVDVVGDRPARMVALQGTVEGGSQFVLHAGGPDRVIVERAVEPEEVEA